MCCCKKEQEQTVNPSIGPDVQERPKVAGVALVMKESTFNRTALRAGLHNSDTHTLGWQRNSLSCKSSHLN